MNEFWASISNKQKSYYMLWITFNFIFFVIGNNSSYADENFWPLESLRIDYYDSTEFLIYTIVPILLYISYWFLNKDREISYFVTTRKNIKLKTDPYVKKIVTVSENLHLRKVLIYSYLGWTYLHITLWLLVGAESFGKFKPFYPEPHRWYNWFVVTESYDLSELIFYLTFPILIYLFYRSIIKRKIKQGNEEKPKLKYIVLSRIIAALHILLGLWTVLYTIGSLLTKTEIKYSILFNFLTIVFGFFYAILGGYLWQYRRWAWIFLIILYSAILFLFSLNIFGSGIPDYDKAFNISIVFWSLIILIILFYTRKIFRFEKNTIETKK